MTTTTGTCWADPLSLAERRELAARFARACWDGRLPAGSYIAISAEMADLHRDVTGRAAVPPEVAGRQEADADADRIIERMKLFTGPDEEL